MDKAEIARTLGLSQAEAALLVTLVADRKMTARGEVSSRALTVAKRKLLKRGLLDTRRPLGAVRDMPCRHYLRQGEYLSSRGEALGLAAVDLGWPLPR